MKGDPELTSKGRDTLGSSDTESVLQRATESLKGLDPTSVPTEWANAQFDLAMAYLQRRCGDRSNNLESAQTALIEAASIYNRKYYAQEWARIMFELGSTQLEMKPTAADDGVTRALHYFEKALQVYERDNHPIEWAECHKAIGEVLVRLSKGSESDLQELALTHYLKAVEGLTGRDSGVLWNTTHLEVSLLFQERTMGDVEQNRRHAEFHHRVAFEFDKNDHPELYSALRSLEELRAQLRTTRDELNALR